MSRQQQAAIDVPGAWLTTVAGRICLNLLGSARARRETYVGEWIPEPLPEHSEWISGRTAGAAAGAASWTWPAVGSRRSLGREPAAPNKGESAVTATKHSLIEWLEDERQNRTAPAA